MEFDHVAWRTERANIHDTNRPVEVEVQSTASAITIIGRAPNARQAVVEVQREAAARGLSLSGFPNPSDYDVGVGTLDHWCAGTWVA